MFLMNLSMHYKLKFKLRINFSGSVDKILKRCHILSSLERKYESSLTKAALWQVWPVPGISLEVNRVGCIYPYSAKSLGAFGLGELKGE